MALVTYIGETVGIGTPVLIDASNGPVTGATVTLTIRRNSDGYTWNGSAFASGTNTVNMTETIPGKYRYDFDVPGATAYECELVAEDTGGTAINGPYFATDLQVRESYSTATDLAGLNDLSAAEVNAEVDTALADYDGPTRAELTADIDSLKHKDGAKTYDNTTDSLEALRDWVGGGGGADWSGTEREMIRDALGITGNKTDATGGQLQDLSTSVLTVEDIALVLQQKGLAGLEDEVRRLTLLIERVARANRSL